MNNTRFDTRSSEWDGDLTVWLRNNAPDNSGRLQRLRQNLCLAREQELTDRQKEVVALYFDQGLSIPQIAEQLHLNRSTVSRTLQRAKDRLYRFLRYVL